MTQLYKENKRYLIKTPLGWENFEGIVKNDHSKEGKCLHFIDGTVIEATLEHKFFISGDPIYVRDLIAGQSIDTDVGPKEIVLIDDVTLEESYDIFNTGSHTYMIGDVVSSNSDEFAFVRPSIAEEFWTAIQPVLSTGGSAIITSTPNTDEDRFAKVWREAINDTDDHGNPNGTGVGRNGFFPIKVTWDKHPERDEEWAQPFRMSLGPAKFKQEFECLAGDTLVNIRLDDGTEKRVTLVELSELLTN